MKKNSVIAIVVLLCFGALVILAEFSKSPAPAKLANASTNAISATAENPTALTEILATTKPTDEIKDSEPVSLPESSLARNAAAGDEGFSAASSGAKPSPVFISAKEAGFKPATTTNSGDWSVILRAGYNYTEFAGRKDAWTLAARLNFQGDFARARAKSWRRNVIPDGYVEMGHDTVPGSSAGKIYQADSLQVRAGLFWPLAHWSPAIAKTTFSAAKQFQLTLGPTVNGGVDNDLSDASNHRQTIWSGYGGVRLSGGENAFIEYTLGGSDGLDGTRQQIYGELPLYQKDGSEIRYAVRGLWNTAWRRNDEVLGVGLFVEIPLDALKQPAKFKGLIPFVR